jgi:hypothetical protein
MGGWMWRITLMGFLVAMGCWHAPSIGVEHGVLRTHAENQLGPACYARDLMACKAQIAHELAAERPPISPRVKAFGPVGAAMDADIEHHKAVAKLQVCLELQGYVREPQSGPAPAWYLLDLLTCAEPVQESPAPDAALVRACMEARGYQVPW